MNVETAMPRPASVFSTAASTVAAGPYRRFQKARLAPTSAASWGITRAARPRFRMRSWPRRARSAPRLWRERCSHQRAAAPIGRRLSSSSTWTMASGSRAAIAAASAGLSASRRSSRSQRRVAMHRHGGARDARTQPCGATWPIRRAPCAAGQGREAGPMPAARRESEAGYCGPPRRGGAGRSPRRR